MELYLLVIYNFRIKNQNDKQFIFDAQREFHIP